MIRNPQLTPNAKRSISRGVRNACVAGLTIGAMLFPTGAVSAQTVPTSFKEERLYGTSQWGTFSLLNVAGTSTMAFDDVTANMTGEFAQPGGSDWTFGTLQATSLKSIQGAAIEVRFSTSGWKDDELLLEYTTDNWATVRRLAAFTPANPPPTGLSTMTFAGLEGVVASPAAANAVQVRFRSAAALSSDTRRSGSGSATAAKEPNAHADNGRGNDAKMTADNRGGNAGSGATTSPTTRSSGTTNIATTSTVTTNSPETYTLSIDQVRLVVKGS